MAARAFRGKNHFCLQVKQIKFHLDDCPKYFSYHRDRQFPPVCPCHGWKSCTNYDVYTPTCALQRDGQIFLTIDCSNSDQNSVLTIAVIYLIRNTSVGVLPGLRDALRNDRESIADRVRYSSPLQWFHVASGSQPAFYSTDIEIFYWRVKRPKPADHLRLA
jgi:hypothetical protein